MSICCSCNAIPTAAFKKAITDKIPEISQRHVLLDAVGDVYRHARDTGSIAESRIIPSCTSCFNWLAHNIQRQTGLFAGQTIPPKSFNQDCPRRAQC